MSLYKRNKMWHMDVTIEGFRYRESLETVDKREAVRRERVRISQIKSRLAEAPVVTLNDISSKLDRLIQAIDNLLLRLTPNDEKRI